MRKVLKILHSLSAAGLLGGLACYMILLVTAQPQTVAAYVDLRGAIMAVCNLLIIPSLGVVLVSGLFAMAVHYPFCEKGWAVLKAALGIVMFKGTLHAVWAKGAEGKAAAEKLLAQGNDMTAISNAMAMEWAALWIIMGLCILNVVLGVWRPRRLMPDMMPKENVAAKGAPSTPTIAPAE
ncbi:MAG: hypothetical protein AAGK25_05040 [Pseudomonadota bacterium]